MAWSTKEAQREYYIRNREHIIKRNRKYKDTHVELRHRDMKSHLRYILGKARLRKKHEFDITPEDLYELWDKQNGLCAYSKQPLTNEVNHLQMASLDRIDSKQGYVKSNIQLLCFAVNKMKQEFDALKKSLFGAYEGTRSGIESFFETLKIGAVVGGAILAFKLISGEGND